MSKKTNPGQARLPEKPPLLPKPTHLTKKTVIPINSRAGNVTGVSGANHKNENTISGSLNSTTISHKVHDEESAVTTSVNCEEIPASCSESVEEKEGVGSADRPDSFEPVIPCLEECSVSEKNQSFLHSENSFRILQNISDTSIEGDNLSSLTSSSILSYSNKSRPNSFCDSDSLESEISDHFSTIRRSLSSCFASIRSVENNKSGSFFYVSNSDSDYNASACDISVDEKTDLQTETSSDAKKQGAEERKRHKAFLVIKEFMTSEQVFIDALTLIVKDFQEFIEQQSGGNPTSIIPSQLVNKIISPLPQLLELNELLLSDLVSRINRWKDYPRIADVIIQKGPFLKLYSTYIKNFEEQCILLDESCQKYPKFAKVLKDFENTNRCKKLTLKHYMLKPVQRIPQYRLLLQEYLDHLDSETVEHKDTLVALDIIHDVLEHANSIIDQGDRLSKLLQIQSVLGNYEIIKPGREYIKDGELYKLSRKEMQLRYFVLLSDCLLYTTYYSSMTGMKVKYELPLCGMKVILPPNDPTEFNVITSTRSFTLRARSEAERLEWVTSLEAAIREKNKKQLSFLNLHAMSKSLTAEPLKLGKEAPVWVQDKKTTMCQLCTAGFTVTFRRHHCRCCGKVVCGSCSNNKAPLQYLKFDTARVCEECYDFLLKEFSDPTSSIFERVKTTLCLTDEETATHLEQMKCSFKKFDSTKKPKKYIPQRLKEVSANDTRSLMSGWLFQHKGKRTWRRSWFVLKDQVLYVYRASQDVVAQQSIPVLGYKIEKPCGSIYEDMDRNLTFMLQHPGQIPPGQIPLVFNAPDPQSYEMWISALRSAITL